jgi:hypothetical protein
VHLIGFIIRKFVTMHGHMNLKIHYDHFLIRYEILRRSLHYSYKGRVLIDRDSGNPTIT